MERALLRLPPPHKSPGGTRCDLEIASGVARLMKEFFLSDTGYQFASGFPVAGTDIRSLKRSLIDSLSGDSVDCDGGADPASL
jgi:hypothetical protein